VTFGDAPGGGAIFHVELPGWEREIAMASEFDFTTEAPRT
jgi:hypothetical protein